MRRYPAPPTGHDLMAFFPPQPPTVRPTPGSSISTSGWFEQQERAYFSKTSANAEKRLSKDAKAKDLSYSLSPQTIHSSTSLDKSSYSSPNSSHARNPTLQLSPQYPTMTVHVPSDPQAAMVHSPSQSSNGSPSSSLGHESSQMEDWRENSDEAWRRPIPFNERRRAGKHTKRVIVRAWIHCPLFNSSFRLILCLLIHSRSPQHW